MLTFKPMTIPAKIALSEKELELVCNADWILTKHAVIQKVYSLFGEVLQNYKQVLESNLPYIPFEVFTHPPKISKGENYRLLPYVMLDYPRYFGKDNTFAIRTFFWWGNFFSVSLQLAGTFKNDSEEMLLRQYPFFHKEGYFISIADDPWQHHFSEQTFIAIKSLLPATFEDMLHRKQFIKITKTIPLSEWDNTLEFLVGVFTGLVNALSNDQAPRR